MEEQEPATNGVDKLVTVGTMMTLPALQQERNLLTQFVKAQLRSKVDFDTIPGTKKPTLLKPGAEKLAKLFGLGSRVVNCDKEISLKDNFAMFSYRVEIYHLKTGQTISQCEGSCNSQEKKYATRKDYKTGEISATPVAEVLNTLQKMAQKRAFVGAVISACGASDFFTQDTEDMDPALFEQAKTVSETQQQSVQPRDPDSPATAPQIKRMFALAREFGVSEETLKAYIVTEFQKEKTAELSKAEIQKVYTFIEGGAQ